MYILFFNFLISLVFLFLGTQLLVNSSITLSNKLNINRFIIGFTIISLATSLPELFVTLGASTKGFNDFAIGNIIGSNISNISLVLGLTALISPVIFSKNEIKLNYFPLVLLSTLFVAILIIFGFIGTLYGLIAIFSLFSYNIYLLQKGKDIISTDHLNNPNILIFLGKEFFISRLLYLFLFLLMGAILLWFGSEILIKSSKDIASLVGLSDRVISISLVAIGTSIPELFASVYAACKKETKLAIGNLLGSNIFNMLAVLGITSCINPINIGPNLHLDVLIMLAFTLLLFPCFYLRNLILKQENITMMIYKFEGLILLILYILYMYFVIV
ncbi:MAG: hypothetical protein CMP49_06235 [Flavobacteriales bacterium]|nr:hypothetical protein [Flavobacteriales bacterium]|tara:strand:- start:4273 stop:5262 length:990 start_codon:yes stop_codon:yes gene_type:complete